MRKIFITLTLIILLMHSVFAADVKIGQLYDLSSEYGECIIFDDSFTLLGNTYQSELMKDTLLPSLKTDDSSYFLLSCTVDDIDFLTILTGKGNKHVFHNWEIPFSKSHNKNVKTVPILEGVYVNSVSGYVSEKSRNGSTVEYLPEKMSLGLNPWAIKADETVKKNRGILLARNIPCRRTYCCQWIYQY